MDEQWKNALIRKYGEVIDGLGHSVRDCPEELWETSVWPVTRDQPWVWPIKRFGQKAFPAEEEQLALLPVISAFWNVAYHAIFHVDFYLSGGNLPYRPPAPFREEEHRPSTVPARTYTKGELLDYLEHCRTKSVGVISDMTPEVAAEPTRGGESRLDVAFWGLAHAQEHQGQFGLFFGQRGVTSHSWSQAQFLRNLMRHRSDAEIDAAVKRLGGYERLLPQVFEGFAASLRPTKDGTVSFDLGAPYAIVAKGGRVRFDRKFAKSADVTVRMSARDFLRMVTRHEAFEALVGAGRIRIEGDVADLAGLLAPRG